MKKIAVVALDPLAGASYTKEVRDLFGEYAEVVGYSVRDGSAAGVLPRADLFAISTDAYGSAEEEARHVPIDSQIMSIEVTFYWETLKKLFEIPQGTKVLFVNVTSNMAREAITQLSSLGVNHLQFIPYYPGAVLEEPVDIAVTPGESRFVPPSVKTVIDCDHRPCSYGMMVEIALRLGLEYLPETESFMNYAKVVASNHYSFDLMYAKSRRQESQMHILAESLDEGLIGVNETGDIFVCNKKACQIARISEELTMGKKGEEVFPYIPFYQVLREKKAVPEKIIRLFGTDISLAVVPVVRKENCIGAFAMLQKFNEQESRQNALRRQMMQKGHYARYTLDDVIGISTAITETKNILRKMAATDSPVLLMGETGTGKELMAHALHQASRRADGPFIAINVAAMPENLLESELFGYEEGAFTGAKKGGRPGLFEFAHQGTLFLDEVEGMSLSMQVKLLRVLQEGEIMRVGGGSIIRVDVRIVAATNESLEEKIQDGSFRKDLYYRLNALTVEIPPLRKRGDDIFLLLDYFMRKMGGDFTLSEGVKAFLRRHPWPGNIRELQNAVEYFNYLAKPVIGLSDLPPTMTRFVDDGSDDSEGEVNDNAADDKEADMAYQAAVDKKQFVLNQLALAWKEGKTAGREKILEAAKKDHISMTQKQVRVLLDELAKEGLIQVGRGRGGSKITEKGLNKLKIN
ncbi:MAG: sigma-54 interaction domain-containing protein [Enterocloster sp.]